MCSKQTFNLIYSKIILVSDGILIIIKKKLELILSDALIPTQMSLCHIIYRCDAMSSLVFECLALLCLKWLRNCRKLI